MSLRYLTTVCVISIFILFSASCVVEVEDVPDVRIIDGVRPACAPIPGSERDPCRNETPPISEANRNAAGHGLKVPPLPLDLEWLYRREWSRQGVTTPQVVIRGIVAQNSARCSEVGAYLIGSDWYGLIEQDSKTSRIVCHVDVDVSEYLAGSGPSRLTIIPFWLRSVPRNARGFGSPAYFAELTSPLRDSLEGTEWVFELARPHDVAWGEWVHVHGWHILRRPNGNIVGRSIMWALFEGRTDVEDWEVPLDELLPKIKSAHAKVAAEYGGRISDEPDSPMLITDASRENLLAQLRELGAYDVPGITPVPAPPAPIPPVEPGELTASPPNNAGGIPLSWTAPDSGMVSSYKVVRRVPKGEFVTVVADTGSTDTTYTDTSAPMTAGVTYIYRVLALNEYGESLASNRATVELPGPDAPADFTATNYEGDVVLTWTQPGAIMPSCYRIYRRAQGEQSFEWVVNCWSADLRSWRDDDVESGTRYIYRIVPMIGYTESGATARASIRVR